MPRLNNRPIPELTPERLEKFWQRVCKTDNCWLWLGQKSKKGYGAFYIIRTSSAKEGNKFLRLAHRVAYKINAGTDPGLLCVLHHCDNPACVNPEHLFLGTKGDNNRDRHEKGRTKLNPQGNHAVGAANGKVKLTEQQVRKIRNEYSGKYGEIAELARAHGVHHSTVWAILKGKWWTHIA